MQDRLVPKSPLAPNTKFRHAFAFLVALGFLWLSFRDAAIGEIWQYSHNIHPFPIFLIFLSVLIGTFIRSYRWTILLKPLRTDSEKPISQFNAFYAVLMGYAVNIVLPRGGELVRLVSMTKTERLPWAGVLATMLIDRMLDVAMLAVMLGFTLIFLPSQTLSIVPGLETAGLILVIAAVFGLILLPIVGYLANKILTLPIWKKHVPEALSQKLTNLTQQFDQGAGALKSATRYPYIAFLSVLIWFSYWLNFYLMVYAFGLEDKINAVKCLVIFTVGSLGSLIPTPGSVGSIHYLVKMAVVSTTQAPPEQALAFATVLHFFIFIVFPSLIAAVAFIYKWTIQHTDQT